MLRKLTGDLQANIWHFKVTLEEVDYAVALCESIRSALNKRIPPFSGDSLELYRINVDQGSKREYLNYF